MLSIHELTATEVLDSRSRPTLDVRLTLDDGREVAAGVPSGASTGSREAVERRDGDPARFGGAGVLEAVAAAEGEIADLLCGRAWASQRDLDSALVALDATPNKSRLGANAVVGVSMAAARAFALVANRPLYRSLADEPALSGAVPRLPVPHFNVLNGGVHAPNELEFQEFMIAPLGATSLPDAVRAGAEVYAALRRRLAAAGFATGLGDEGGFAPEVRTPEDACQVIVTAITDAGYEPGPAGVALALDPAASEFRADDGSYQVGGERLSSGQMIERYVALVDRFPIHSIEDGLAEDDDEGWKALTDRLGGRVQLVGDDNFVTNPEIIARAITAGIANAALIKLNQVGTVAETLDALRLCRDRGYGAMVSHRSGETTDDFIADLTVAAGCGQLKSGAPARGERVAKYNRLLAISRSDPSLPYGLPPK